jgi:hypothetical protein
MTSVYNTATCLFPDFLDTNTLRSDRFQHKLRGHLHAHLSATPLTVAQWEQFIVSKWVHAIGPNSRATTKKSSILLLLELIIHSGHEELLVFNVTVCYDGRYQCNQSSLILTARAGEAYCDLLTRSSGKNSLTPNFRHVLVYMVKLAWAVNWELCNSWTLVHNLHIMQLLT